MKITNFNDVKRGDTLTFGGEVWTVTNPRDSDGDIEFRAGQKDSWGLDVDTYFSEAQFKDMVDHGYFLERAEPVVWQTPVTGTQLVIILPNRLEDGFYRFTAERL